MSKVSIALGSVLLVLSGHAVAASPNDPAPSSPQREPTFQIGDGTVSGARLTPYDNAFIVRIRDKDGQTTNAGIWTEQLRLRELDGRKVFVRTQGMVACRRDSTNLALYANINVVDAATLAPVRSEQLTPDGHIVKWTFNGALVEMRVTETPGAKEEVRQFDTPTPAFDLHGGMYGPLLRALPLRAGYSGVIPAHGEITDGYYQTIPFNVIGRETVRAGLSGPVEAWVIEVHDAARLLKFWISDKPPFTIRFTVPGPAYDQTFESIRFSR